MLFRCASIITLLICAQGALSAGSNFSLYAYGDKLPTGMKLFHADGQAYIGRKPADLVNRAVNITFALTDDMRFLASPESAVPSLRQSLMYIGADANDLKTVGFCSEDAVPEGSVVKGFGLFGGWAYNNQKSGVMEMNFVAASVGETGLYQIKWNVANDKIAGDHIPVSLRTEAPSTPED